MLRCMGGREMERRERERLWKLTSAMLKCMGERERGEQWSDGGREERN